MNCSKSRPTDTVAVQKTSLTHGAFEKGLNNVVKDNDLDFPPEWRLSRSGRRKP